MQHMAVRKNINLSSYAQKHALQDVANAGRHVQLDCVGISHELDVGSKHPLFLDKKQQVLCNINIVIFQSPLVTALTMPSG